MKENEYVSSELAIKESPESATENSLLVKSQADGRLADAMKELRDLKFALDESSIVAITDRRGTIIYVNDRFCSISGYARSELLGQNHRILNSDHHDEEFFVTLWRTISSGRTWRGEIRNRAKDGSFYWVNTVIVPVLDARGKPVQYISIRNDITEQKRIQEDLLRAKRDAEAASLAKTQFLANVSHEIRTPLGIILGFASLVKDEELSEAERCQALDTILRNGEQLTKLVDEILDVSKVESNRLEIEMIPFSLHELLRETGELFEFKAKERGLDFRINFKTSLPETVKSDPTRIKQILANVIGNAIKFTSKGAVDLDVHAARSEQDGGQTIEFIVRDTGIGLSPEQQKRIFRPFSQADSSTTRRFGGTGLGLHLSRRLARTLGGDLVLASSQSEVGSVFVAFVPVEAIHGTTTPYEPQRRQDAVDRGSSLLGMRILIVDDSADNRSLISRFLRAEGAELETAEDGRDGVTKALSGDFDAVLMDIQMPIMDGYEALVKLRELQFLPPVFALTAHAFKEEREKCLAAGFVDHLVKPVDRKHLISRLQGLRN